MIWNSFSFLLLLRNGSWDPYNIFVSVTVMEYGIASMVFLVVAVSSVESKEVLSIEGLVKVAQLLLNHYNLDQGNLLTLLTLG